MTDDVLGAEGGLPTVLGSMVRVSLGSLGRTCCPHMRPSLLCSPGHHQDMPPPTGDPSNSMASPAPAQGALGLRSIQPHSAPVPPRGWALGSFPLLTSKPLSCNRAALGAP